MKLDFKKVAGIIFIIIVILIAFRGLVGLGITSSLGLFAFSSGSLISFFIGIFIISMSKNSLAKGHILGGGILFIIGINIAFRSLISFFPILSLVIDALMISVFLLIGISLFLSKEQKAKLLSKFMKKSFKDKDDHNQYRSYKQDEYGYKRQSNSGYRASKKAREFFGEDPNDPFSYNGRKVYNNVEDVEYEDWSDDGDSKKKSSPVNDDLEYSYSQNTRNNAKTHNHQKQDFDDDLGYNYYDEKVVSDGDKYSVNLGSLNINISQDDLRDLKNDVYVSCTLGEVKILIDKNIPTNINANISMGEVKIGKAKYNGINKKIYKKWVPKTPIDKTLNLHCSVSMGEIKIRHKKF